MDSLIKLAEIIINDLDIVNKRIDALERRVSGFGPPSPKPLRVKRGYADYLNVRRLMSQGVGYSAAARMLGMPFSTVRFYALLEEDDPLVRRLKRAAERGRPAP
jgi:hypothetical protein